MKKIFLLIVLALIAYGGYTWYKGKATDINIAPEVSRPDPSNASFDFEDGKLTLKDGRAEEEIAPGSALTAITEISDVLDYGDVNGDDKNDTALLLIREGGGSGVFIYIAAYVSGNVAYKGSNAIFVGDRISPDSLSIENGVITLKYLDRRPDEPMSEEPTVPKTKTYTYTEGRLEEN